MILVDWYQITVQSLQDLYTGVIAFLPRLGGALIVFIIGWFVSSIIAKIVADVLKRLKFNEIFERDGLKKALEKADIKIDPSEFIGMVFMWAFMFVFLLASVEILGFNQLAAFLQRVLGYLPNVLSASLIFVVAVIIADIVGKILHATVEGAQMGSGHIVSIIVKWSIWIFAVAAILLQLGIGKPMVDYIMMGIVGFVVISGGLAFGLGGKEVAAELLQDLKRKLKG